MNYDSVYKTRTCVLSHSATSNSLQPHNCSPWGSSVHRILQARIHRTGGGNKFKRDSENRIERVAVLTWQQTCLLKRTFLLGHLADQNLQRFPTACRLHPKVATWCSWSSISFCSRSSGIFLVAQMVKNLPAMQETQVQSLGQKEPLEKGMATHSSILAEKIPWTEESGGLQSSRLQIVGHDWVTDTRSSEYSSNTFE